jgi:ubiquinone/menaquinone biosynthesis C-methylase UbiE
MPHLPTGSELIDPQRLLMGAGLEAGSTVAELGCGTLGHYVFPAAALVGEGGRVFAIDILKSVLSSIESRIKLEGSANVTPLWGDIERERGVDLPDASVDFALLINNVFLSKHRAAMFREGVRLVKPGGRFLVVEWRPGEAPIGPPPATRVAPEEVRRLAAAAGLVDERSLDPGELHYAYLYRKPR